MADRPRPRTRVGTWPHEEVLLRWTAAFKEKWQKLQEYQRKGIVGPDDAYVIAISGVQLGSIGSISMDHGISGLPLAVETVFPVGPLVVILNRETRRVEGSRISDRFLIRNANNAEVPITPFVDPAYAGVSAVFACSIYRCTDLELPAFVVHNPLARVQIRSGTLGTSWGNVAAVVTRGSRRPTPMPRTSGKILRWSRDLVIRAMPVLPRP